jgi:hypothetical protein
MPPKKGIVKSGNAGNSSKSSKEATDSSKGRCKTSAFISSGLKISAELTARKVGLEVSDFGQEGINMSIGAQKTIGKNPQSTLYGSYGVFCDMTIFIFL